MALIAVSMLFVAGCAGNGKLEVLEADPLPVIEPYKDFDVSTIVSNQKGVSYVFNSATYVDRYGDETDININDSHINVNKDTGCVVISVTAKKGENEVTKDITLFLEGTPDKVDYGMSELWADDGIAKSLNYDPKYIKDGNSSLKVSFSGYYVDHGTQFCDILGRLDDENGIYDNQYYSIYKEADIEKAWEDAVMTFFINYSDTPKNNPDAKLDIGYRFRHRDSEEVAPQYRRDYEFGQSPITSCKPGQWTQIVIRFKDLGKVTEMYLNHEKHYDVGFDLNTDCDLLNLKCRVFADDFSSGDTKYGYTFYMDGVDIMTYEDFVNKYPSFDFGSDYGDTVRKLEIENWLDGDKGLSFVYSFADPDDVDYAEFALFYEYMDEEGENHWHRLTEHIRINFILDIASAGKIVDLGNGKYRYELMFKDATRNLALGEETDGTESVNLIWYRYYNTRLKTDQYKEINQYS